MRKNAMKNKLQITANNHFRRFIVSCILFTVFGPILWAGGWKDQIETVDAEGGEIWENDFDVTARKKGKYNYVVYAHDRAGNENVSGPFNIKVDHNAGLSVARVIYPENNAIIRQHINLMGVASGRYGVSQVLARLDDGEYETVEGTEYWNKLEEFADIPDGKHSFFVYAIDEKGVSGPVQRINFILDTSPPQFELHSHEIGDIITGSVTMKGIATDPNGIKKLEYSEDGHTFSTMKGKGRGTDFEFAVPINTKRLPDGPMVFYLRAVDNTDIASVKPYLFFVSNAPPQLEIFSPTQGEDVYNTFFLTGFAYDTIGLARVYYEWGKTTQDIEMRAGDPFWYVPLKMDKNAPNSIKVVAVNRAGTVSSVTRKLEDKRKVKVPVLVIDYPTEEGLRDIQRGMPEDMAIYGHIAPGSDPHSVLIEGNGDIEATPAFRLDPEKIPAGAKAQTLKLTPVDNDMVQGSAISIKYLKTGSMPIAESDVDITAPVINNWYSGSSFSLEGKIGSPQNAELQVRLNPNETWQSVRLDPYGNFLSEVGMSGRPQGPIHMELKVIRNGQALYPKYHPFNWAEPGQSPEFTYYSPAGERSLIYGTKTVMGAIDHGIPIQRITYSLGRGDETDLPFISRSGKTWFTYFCDFNTLGRAKGQLTFHITDESGNTFNSSPDYQIEPNPPLPVIIVNTPSDDSVITDAFTISGLAYDDVGIAAVYWRILGPKLASISPAPIGDEARGRAIVYEANPDIEFNEYITDEKFDIPIDFSIITDGEYIVEIYAADPYGVCSETTARTIKVSTSPPQTVIIEPVITRYNRKAITVHGLSSDANFVGSVFLSMDNGNTWQNVNLHGDGRWELVLNTANYKDGIYSALVRTTDRYGIVDFSNVMINIDNTPPDMALTNPLDGQHVGTNLQLMGRVDDMTLNTLTVQIINAEDPGLRRIFDLEPRLTIFDTISFDGLPQGEYMIRIIAQDLADNETLISRKIIYDADDAAAQIAIYNPLPGEFHSGPVNVTGIVYGSFQPEEVQLMLNDRPLSSVPVDRYGVFSYEIPDTEITKDGSYKISAYYYSETRTQISSPDHSIYYTTYGPILQIDSHIDGDVITGRPWLSGIAWANVSEMGDGEQELTRQEKMQLKNESSVDQVLVSHDNGRTFETAQGKAAWKFRLETSLLPSGPQPILVRAIFADGKQAVRRIMLHVDTTLPDIETISPPENSTHRDNVYVYGTAGDNYELANVNISLRPHDKFFYSVPGPIQGLYFDVKGFGATYFDVGLGLSLFDNNVRLQVQWGMTPGDGKYRQNLVEGGRFVGDISGVYGLKLLANIFYLPFDYLFGLDWGFYSMNFAVGANFSYFTMDDWRKGLFMGAIVGQWDIINVNFQFFKPNWKYFRNYALYLEPELWFASSDVKAETIFRMTVGMRINWF